MTRAIGIAISRIAIRMLLAGVAVALLALALPPAASAQTQAPTKRTLYRLDKDAMFQRGCFGPCMCPVLVSARVRGTFLLTHVGFDGLFDNYAVTDVSWIVTPSTGSKIPIKGQGTYKVGGEFAVQQELSLDLVVGTDPVTHYDSGLVTGPSDFPRIDLTISINGGACFDTVITVRSRPAIDLAVGTTALSWDPVPQATGYDVVRGDLGALRSSGGDFSKATTECLAAGTGATSVPFSRDPAPGQAFWFLARWADSGGCDSYDEDDSGEAGSCDAGIEASPASCP